MKSIIKAWILLMIISLSSCITDNVGPQGPQGPQGNDGPQGPQGESGFVFEFENVDFTAPEYEVFLTFPNDFETLSSDVALVYLLWDVVDIDGVSTEVWRQLPQTIVTQDGMLQYNFDFSMVDVRLFLDAEFNLDNLTAVDTDDWVARVVIVPGNIWNTSRLNKADLPYDELKEMLGLPDLPTPQSALTRR